MRMPRQVRKLFSLAVTLLVLVAALAVCGSAAGSSVPTTSNAVVPGGGGGWPNGCRDIDISTSQHSFLFGTTVYRFHALEHWCWGGGGISEERHGWSYDGSSTSCLGTVYPENAWFYTYWGGIGTSGHYLEERAHVTNCVFHIGDWKEFYPNVKIWIRADGSYTAATSN
jgi:hypothetical protein